jgi:hypothetical protein
VIRLLALGMAVVSFAIGAFFAASCFWLMGSVVMSSGYTLLYFGPTILLAGAAAALFLLAGRACLMTARVDRKPKAEAEEVFK